MSRAGIQHVMRSLSALVLALASERNFNLSSGPASLILDARLIVLALFIRWTRRSSAWTSVH